MRRNTTARRFSGAIMLGGLAAIALLGISAWPWILVVLALSVLPTGYTTGGAAGAAIPALWLIGLVIVITADLFWPGVIVLIVLSVILRRIIMARR